MRSFQPKSRPRVLPPLVELPSVGQLPAVTQPTFDDLGTPLAEVAFVVLDLETTGGSPATSEITEIGAVKVRAGEVLGEFQTLVRPSTAIPPFIAVLTGITDTMVASAPRLPAVLPELLDFVRGCVVVAHNAPFDVGFLMSACEQLGLVWPKPPVVDTVRLARQVLTREETPNCKLSSLAPFFGSPTTPDHRALSDARATVHVLHGLLARLGNRGVTSLEELLTYSTAVTTAQRRKKHLADEVPHVPGVYVFEDARGRPLYVGTSRDLRTRVRSYFTAGETRSRIRDMVAVAERVRPIPCPTALEAEVRELRLIAEYKPPYNRRSRFPERLCWVKLTAEAFPRLSIVRDVKHDDADYLGPFASSRSAESAVAVLHEVFQLRQCTVRLSRRPSGTACVLAEMGRCLAPCEGRQSLEDYALTVAEVRTAFQGDVRPLVDAVTGRLRDLAAQERFEEAAVLRDRLAAFVRAASRTQRLSALTRCPELVAARPTEDRGWELVVVRHGRLVASGVAARGVPPLDVVAALRAGAEVVAPPPAPRGAASVEESECVARWLESGARLVSSDSSWSWSCPAYGAGSYLQRLDQATSRDGLPKETLLGLRSSRVGSGHQ
ncbi:MAG: DEDD exonuclease domain-containing protein [Actinomycetes bacterium]